MIDRTSRPFCLAWQLCIDGDNCPDALTDDVKAAAALLGVTLVNYTGNRPCLRLPDKGEI